MFPQVGVNILLVLDCLACESYFEVYSYTRCMNTQLPQFHCYTCVTGWASINVMGGWSYS